MMTELRRILLAEDNANDVELTLTALKANRIVNDVIVTRDGAETLDYLLRRGQYANRVSEDPALILLDLKMPKVDGLEVLRLVKSTATLKLIPVVVLTSSRQEPDLIKSYDLGVNAYVVKPVDFHDFVDAVKLLGGFWALVNEPPPRRAGTESSANEL
jgi:CheY-like chemotaxis protein